MKSKYKYPTLEQYRKAKESLAEEQPDASVSEIEDQASVLLILQLNGPMKEDAINEAVAEFSVEISLLEGIESGYMRVIGSKHGELIYEMTDKGIAYVESMNNT